MKQNSKILILKDYRGQFWLKSTHKEANFNLELLENSLTRFGFSVEILKFNDLDFKKGNYKNNFVVYQSQEDPNHYYKSFIGDCLLALHLKGAILLPKYEYFKAHDNKVFMEMLRDVNKNKNLNSLQAYYYGTYEEYKNSFDFKNKPKVFKLSSGAQSKNVFLLKTRKNFLNIPKKNSRTFNLYYWLIDKIKPFLSNKYPAYVKKSHNRRKFIIQNFVPDLNEDFKILVYGRKYFVLQRGIKPKDFKASGSGLFSFTKDLPKGLLDYAKSCFKSFDSPFMGLDIAVKNGKFYLIEFQFVNFGNYTLEKAPFHFVYNDSSNWIITEGKVNLEEEFASTIFTYVKEKYTF